MFERMRHDRNRKREGAKVADGLAHLHAHQSEEVRKNEDQRDEEESAAGRGQQVGGHWLAARLGQHVARHDEAVEWQRADLPAQGDDANGDDLGIIAKDADEMITEQPAEDRADDEKDCADGYREPIGTLQTGDETGTEAEATKRLETLSQADDDGHDHHRDAVDNTHGSDGGVAVVACGMVEHHRGQTEQSLTAQRRAAAEEDFLEGGP